MLHRVHNFKTYSGGWSNCAAEGLKQKKTIFIYNCSKLAEKGN